MIIPLARVLARPLLLLALLILATGGAGAQTESSSDDACRMLRAVVGRDVNAGPALQRCFDHPPSDGHVALPPGLYQIKTPLRIVRPLSLGSRGYGPQGSAPCDPDGDQRCAKLVFQIPPAITGRAGEHQWLPLLVASDGVTFDHLVLSGARGRDKATDRALCAPITQPAGGGLEVRGDGFTITNSAIINFTCYAAFQVTGRNRGLTVVNNWIGRNGDHLTYWSDGLSVQEAENARIEHNTFIDNTDVQLIFGGCQSCIVRKNTFRHSGSASGGSFAELMIQAWPQETSGNYDRSVFSDNTIDCSPKKRCGFGIMIGGGPWYHVPTSGGEVTDNKVTNAMAGLNIQNLSGPMILRRNYVTQSGGTFMGSCGPQQTAAINIDEPSRYVINSRDIERVTGTRASARKLCILNYPPKPLISTLYHELLGRAPDPLGERHWLDKLENGVSLKEMRADIASSPECAAKISSLYRRYRGRNADNGDIQAAQRMLVAGQSLNDIAAMLSNR